MDFEPHEELKRENSEDVADAEIMEPKNRCPLSKISQSVITDPISTALGIPEVLTCIVKHLPAGDLINFRRVCRLWNENCEPKFVFQFDLHPEIVAALLLNSSCRIIKLEFRFYHLRDFPVDTWKICGRKIRSLHLHHCDYDLDTLQSIISNCIALEELTICRCLHGYSSQVSPLHWLEYFIERKEQRARLRAFAVEGPPVTNLPEFLKKTFTVFPCIVHLSCILHERYGESYSASHGTYDYDILRTLKSFTIMRLHDYYWSTNVEPILDFQLLRLKKFKTSLNLEDFFLGLTDKEKLFQFFTVHKNLEVIDLLITRSELDKTELFRVFLKKLMFHVLRTCQNLREFQLIGDHGSIKLDSEESEEFFSLVSNLQCLKLSYDLMKDIPATKRKSPSEYFKKLSLNQTDIQSSLPKLSSSVLRLNTQDLYFFSSVKLTTRLKHLCIDVYSDVQLREIFTALPNLETLIIRLHGCTDHGLIGESEQSSITRLQRLEYLYIIDFQQKITKKIFDKFCFPKLKYLGLILHNEDNLPERPEIFLNMPALNTFIIRLIENNRWPTERVFQFYSSLRNIENLIVHEAFYLDGTTALNIFMCQPNLKFISTWGIDHGHEYRVVYVFNRITAKVQCWFEDDSPKLSENVFFGKICGPESKLR